MAYAYRSVKSAIKDETFKVHIKTEKTEYKGDASHVIVLLSNFIGDKKMFDHNRVGSVSYTHLDVYKRQR